MIIEICNCIRVATKRRKVLFMNDIRKQLNINIQSPYWDEAYSCALSEPGVPEWLCEEYIRTLHTDLGLLPQNLETIIFAIPHIVKVPELCLLAKTLYHILASKKGFSEAFTAFELPKAPEDETNSIGYDCFALFPILAHLRPSWEELEARGIEKSVLTDSLLWADSLFTSDSEKAGKPFFSAEMFQSYGVAIYINSLIIGRLRFEIHKNSNRPARIFADSNGELCVLMDNVMLHKSGHILGSYSCTENAGAYPADFAETEDSCEGYAVNKESGLAENFRTTLSKKEWKPVYIPGDNAIKVHIPYGGKLDKASCADSFKRAREIFTHCFSEINFKCFLICCWMLSPELKDILSPESNIIAFQERFTVFPAKSSALGAFLYVFGIKAQSVSDIDIGELPEKNSLACGIKEKALSGKYIHQFNGFIPW